MTGIGYRKDFAEEFLVNNTLTPDFIEVAPENWIGIGGYWKKQFQQALERYPLFVHGLSLSIGSPDPLDLPFLRQVKDFLTETNANIYSEHLSYAKCDNAHLYDLLPIPFTRDAVHHVADRVHQVQELLQRTLTLEIVSYYTPVAPEMTEGEFISEVVSSSGCDLLLDVNNIYVNSFNHHYDPYEFLDLLPLNKVSYIHMAGHKKVADDLIIDTHGEAIIDPVYRLFANAIQKLGRNVPVLLERDFNIPELNILQQELDQLRTIKSNALKQLSHATV